MPNDIGIIDVWTQYLSPDAAGEAQPGGGERLPQLRHASTWYHNGTDVAQMLDDMDRNGVADRAASRATPSTVREARAPPSRAASSASTTPTRPTS